MDKERFQFTRSLAVRFITVMLGVLFFSALSHFGACLTLLGTIWNVTKPFFIGLAFAYLLDPFVEAMQKRGLSRWLGVLITCVLGLLFFAAALILALPQLFTSLRSLIESVPDYYSALQKFLIWAEGKYGFDAAPILSVVGSYVELMDQFLNFVLENLPILLRYGQAFGGVLVQLFTGSIMGIYILLEKNDLRRKSKKIVYALCSPHLARRVFHVIDLARGLLRSFIGGKLLDCLAVWLFCLLLFVPTGIPYAFLVSLVMGITSFLPVIGPIVGCLFCFLLLLILSPAKAVIFLLLTVVICRLEAMLIRPRLEETDGGIKSLWMLAAILVGGRAAGLIGMIFSVPVLGTCWLMLREFVDFKLQARAAEITSEDTSAAVRVINEPPRRSADEERSFAEAFQRASAAAKDSLIEIRLDEADATLTDIWSCPTSELPREYLEELLRDLDDLLGEDTTQDPS